MKILNDLISTCRDSEEGFGKAAKGVHSDDLRDRFMRVVEERRRFLEELQECGRRLGAQPVAERGHGGGPLGAGWVDLEQRIRPKDDDTFVEDCIKGELSTVDHYEHALANEIPTELRQLAERQFQAVEQTVAALRNLAGTRA